MAKKFKYTQDKRTGLLTLMWAMFAASLVALALVFLTGSYLHAWILSLLFAVIALYMLSIPRRIILDEHNLEIRCVAEITRIDVRDIRSIRKAEKKEFNRLVPMIGSYGFFGYYGYYLNLRGWEMVKVYATQWSHFVEIIDIYEQTYIISCQQADELIESVMQVKLIHAGERSKKDPAN